MAAAVTTPVEAYQPCNILVTGGAGFIASAVVRHLCKAYASYKIVVLDKLDYCANIRNLDEVKRCVTECRTCVR